MRSPDSTARRWLDTAHKDLDVARIAANASYHAHACFNSHQAAGKAVKAIHYAKGARTILGHSVRQLIERLDIASLGALLSGARQLDLYYVPSRYPIGLDDGTPHEAFSADQSYQALGIAQDIVTAAADIISASARDQQS